MSSNTRIYSVSQKGEIVEDRQPLPRLIRASNQAQAMRHVAKATLNVNVATQDELVRALQAGTKVEEASDAADQLAA